MPPRASRPLILLGTLQGGVLWWLWHAYNHQLWPSTAPLWQGAMLWVALAVPAAFYLSENSGLSRARRTLLIAVVAVAYALFGTYAGWMGMPLETLARSGPPAAFGQVLAALILGFMLVPLVAAWDGAQRKWHYPQLFELAWRNGLLSVSVVALTGLFWGVLWAGAMLMGSLGLNFIRELISESVFAFPVTGMVVGAVFAQGHARADMLVNLRRYWLALNTWLLPLLLVFGVMWVVALPFTGLEPLFRTRHAAYILLWFTALAVLFINAAWQDGDDSTEAVPYPHWLAQGIRGAWITLVPVTLVAGWALYLRVHQYGWTEDRVWAVFVWFHAAAYAIGYALSLVAGVVPRLQGRGWMPSVGPTNIVVALLGVVSLVLLVSPVADPRRLAVNDQVARLHSGSVTPQAFDYRYLRFESGRWGLLALQDLARGTGDARERDIAGRARQTLAQESRYDRQDATAKSAQGLSLEDARARIQVLPAGAALSSGLLEVLRMPGSDYRTKKCLQPESTCTAWLHDFNGDGRNEVLLLVTSGEPKRSWTEVLLFAEADKGWAFAATFGNQLSLQEWQQAIDQQQVKTVQQAWPDLEINNKRLPVSIPPQSGTQ